MAALRTDVCIVGAGPAGILLANRLALAGRRVLLLESGEAHETPEARDLNRGSVDPPGSHEPLEENRRRRYGGAGTVWGGRCVPFDPIDLQFRPWVAGSGWPLAYDDVARHHGAALLVAEAGAPLFTAGEALPGTPPETLPGLDDETLASDRLERWSPPVDFGAKYARSLAADPRVQLLLGATVTHLQLEADGRSVQGLDVLRADGSRLRVLPQHVVLAAGALESTRLLLASRDVATQGIGNGDDQLGRYYMTHLFGTVARLRPTSVPLGDFQRDADGVYVRRRFWVTATAQREQELLNTVLFLARPTDGGAGHRDALFSGIYVAKAARAAVRDPRHAVRTLTADPALREHGTVVLHDLPSLARRAPSLVRGRLARRRLPMVLPRMTDASIPVQFQAEHAPNPASRVRLSADRDATGVPRLVLSPAFGDLDRSSVVGVHRLLAERLQRSGTGRLEYDESALLQALDHVTGHANSAAHQLGTTRMSEEPRHGVVDPDLRVHGVRNLSVLGSSVFPTSGHANPTLMVLALTLRLADHLTRRATA